MTSTRFRRWSRATLAVALVAGLLAVPAATTAGGQSGDAQRLTVGSAALAPDESGTLQVTLSAVPDGLAGYEVTIELASGGVARVTEASYPDGFSLTSDPDIARDGQSVTLEAAVTDLDSGTTDVTLATVTVVGAGGGESAVRVADATVDADDGSRIAPTLESGEITVEPADDGQSAGGDGDRSAGGAREPSEDSTADEDQRSVGDGSDEDGLHTGLTLAGVGVAAVLVVGALLRFYSG